MPAESRVPYYPHYDLNGQIGMNPKDAKAEVEWFKQRIRECRELQTTDPKYREYWRGKADGYEDVLRDLFRYRGEVR